MAAYVIFDVESPPLAAWAPFYTGPVYQGRKALRDECSSALLVAAESPQP